jgi:hypothetical protein
MTELLLMLISLPVWSFLINGELPSAGRLIPCKNHAFQST